MGEPLETVVVDPADLRIARVASRQYGAIAFRQLRGLGLTDRAIRHRVAAGRLHPVHRGVFLVGHRAAAPFSPYASALLAIGTGAALTHHVAGELHAIRPRPADGVVDITVPSRGRASRDGIRVHAATQPFAPEELVRSHGLRVSSPARTLLDLAGCLTPRDLGWTLEEALVKRIVSAQQIDEMLQRHPRRRGRAVLAAAIDERRGTPSPTRSEAERRLLDLIRSAGLPPPKTNVELQGYEVDMLWCAERLVVEVDGFAFHSTRAAFERDRRRDAVLQLAGYRVLRLTWRHVVNESHATVAMLARALA